MEIQIRSKRMLAGITVIAAVLIAIAGTFAWNSITQQRINLFTELVVPGVNLHDDFDSPNKDVYVENSGDVPVIVRVRLTEFLQTAGQESLVAGHVREGANETDNARLNWTPHSGIPAVNECEPDDYHTQGDYWSVNDWFHEYYTWTMGGQKYYMPAKELLGQVEDEQDEDFGEYIALLDNPPVCDDPVEYTYEDYIAPGSPVRQTLNAEVITMADWLAGENKQGDFWVVDVDGWCYWAKPLDPQTATGLLLNSVERTAKAFGSDAEYCINVWLQAADEIDIGLFGVEQNGGATENAKLLTQMIANRVVLAEGGEFFENKNDGSFVQLTDNEGNVLENPKPFIPLGAAAATATAAEKVNTPEENKLYVGDRFNFMSLEWDGESYTNYEELAALEPPLYNIAKTEDGEYSVIGCEIGADGKVYLKIEDGEGTAYYLASVLVEASGARAEIFAFTNSIAYKQGYPGTGPFGIIYPGAVGIGSAEDTRYDPELYEERTFRKVGIGVYIEVADSESAEPADDPVKLYFASELLGEVVTLNNIKQELKSAVAQVFPSEMTEGSRLDLETSGIDDANGNPFVERIILSGEGKYEAFGISVSKDGAVIDLGDDKTLTFSDSGWILAAERDGSKELPFLIKNRADLEELAASVNGGDDCAGMHYQIDRDISMGLAAFTPIGNASKAFRGILDGNEKLITGLKVSTDSYAGLFGHVGEGGVVKNVRLQAIDIDGGDYVGGVAGYINKATVENCDIVSGRINASKYEGEYIGGIAGFNNSSVIRRCSNAAGFEASPGDVRYIGGIVGYNGNASQITGNSPTVELCYNKGSLKIDYTSCSYVGGIAGYHEWGIIQNCYAWGTVEDADTVYGKCYGGIAGYNEDRVENVYHAMGDIYAGSYGGGIIGHNGAWGKLKNAVAYANWVDAHNYSANAVIGFNEGEAESCYSWAGMVNHANDWNGVEGWLVYIKNPPQEWWASEYNEYEPGNSGPEFDFDEVWTWDSINKFPILINVGP